MGVRFIDFQIQFQYYEFLLNKPARDYVLKEKPYINTGSLFELYE